MLTIAIQDGSGEQDIVGATMQWGRSVQNRHMTSLSR
jgi:hypothetical protein